MLTHNRGASAPQNTLKYVGLPPNTKPMPQQQSIFTTVVNFQNPHHTVVRQQQPQILTVSRNTSNQVKQTTNLRSVRGERPTVTSVDNHPRRGAEHSQEGAVTHVSITPENSVKLASLHQSQYTNVVPTRMYSTKPMTPQHQRIQRERDLLRKEREQFSREQEAARREQQEIRAEQNRIRKEHEEMRKEHKKMAVNREKESPAIRNDSQSVVENTVIVKVDQSNITHNGLYLPDNIPDNSRLTGQSPSYKTNQLEQVLKHYEIRVAELEETVDNQAQHITQTIEIAQRREKQINDTYRKEIQALQTERNELLELNRRSQSQISLLREEVERAARVSGEQYLNEIDRLTNLVMNKEKQINQLNGSIKKLEADISNNKGNEFDSNLKLINCQKRVHLLESQIERYNEDIKTKNAEIMELRNIRFQPDKNAVARHFESASREVERLNDLIMQKTNEISQYRTEVGELQIKLAKVLHRADSLKDQKESEIARLNDLTQTKDFQYSRLKQSYMLRQAQLRELQTFKDQSKHKITLLEEEVERARNQSKYLISDLQYRSSELEKKNRQLESELRGVQRSLSTTDLSRIRSEASLKPQQLRTLQQKISELTSAVEKDKAQHIQSRRISEQSILTLEKQKGELQVKVSNLQDELKRRQHEFETTKEENKRLQSINSDLMSRESFLAQNNSRLSKQLQQIKMTTQAKQSELDRKSQQIDQLNHQYQNALQHFRNTYENSFNQTINQYESKINFYEKELKRSQRGDSFNHSTDRKASGGKSDRHKQSADKVNVSRHTDQLSQVNRYMSPIAKLSGDAETQRIVHPSEGRRPDLTFSKKETYRPAQVSQLAQRLQQREQEVSKLQQRLREVQQTGQKSRIQHEKSLAEKQSLIRTIRIELDEEVKQRSYYEQETVKLQQTIDSLSRQLSELANSQAAQPVDLEYVRQLEESIIKLKEGLKQANTTIFEIRQEKAHILEDISRYQNEIQRLKALQQQVLLLRRTREMQRGNAETLRKLNEANKNFKLFYDSVRVKLISLVNPTQNEPLQRKIAAVIQEIYGMGRQPSIATSRNAPLDIIIQ